MHLVGYNKVRLVWLVKALLIFKPLNNPFFCDLALRHWVLGC